MSETPPASWIDPLERKASLSPELIAWARNQPDLATAWSACERVDWLIELGGALDLDDPSQRALVVAVSGLGLLDEPTLLRLQAPAHRIARAWALGGDAESLDLLNLGRFADLTNAAVIYLPPGLTLILVLRRLDVPRSITHAIAALTIPAMYGVAASWRFARVRLTERAIRHYRFERAERDVLRPTLAAIRRAMQLNLNLGLIDRFRRGWHRVADFPAPRART